VARSIQRAPSLNHHVANKNRPKVTNKLPAYSSPLGRSNASLRLPKLHRRKSSKAACNGTVTRAPSSSPLHVPTWLGAPGFRGSGAADQTQHFRTGREAGASTDTTLLFPFRERARPWCPEDHVEDVCDLLFILYRNAGRTHQRPKRLG
jgi:hypothetical protein